MKHRNDSNLNAGRSAIDGKSAAIAAGMVDLALYNALRSVFIDGAYCAQALTKALKGLNNVRQHPFVTSAFYGVLDNNVRLEKTISSLCQKPPDKNAAVVLRIGIYYCNYADIPSYAAVNRTVELAKKVGVFSGFVNAVLKRSINFIPEFSSALDKFAYDRNTPEWLCKEIVADYGEVRAAAILDEVLPLKTHIRPVKNRITPEEFASAAKGGDFTEYGCYVDRAALDNFAAGTVAVQSVSSIRAVNAYVRGISGGKALDLCAAPGGKSVYLSECGAFDITACDVYAHKIDLMRGYAKKLGAKIKLALNDATVTNPDFIGAFDLVIADCPCSGTGTLRTKPDILIKRKKSDIAELTALQKSILSAAADYCKAGGTLCYSTCSILCAENERIAEWFVGARKDYTLTDVTKLLPDTDKCDGFFIARFKRNEKC